MPHLPIMKHGYRAHSLGIVYDANALLTRVKEWVNAEALISYVGMPRHEAARMIDIWHDMDVVQLREEGMQLWVKLREGALL